MITIRNIREVRIHSDFFLHSRELGNYQADVIAQFQDEISALVAFWKNQQFVEIYSENHERQWGRIKSSSDNTTSPGAIPYFIGIFHSRVLKDEVDPLLVLTFEEDALLVNFFTDHDTLFGSLSLKHQPQKLKTIKKKISDWLFGDGSS